MRGEIRESYVAFSEPKLALVRENTWNYRGLIFFAVADDCTHVLGKKLLENSLLLFFTILNRCTHVYFIFLGKSTWN